MTSVQIYRTVIGIIQITNLSVVDVDSKNVLINASSPQPHIWKRVYIPVINIYYNSLWDGPYLYRLRFETEGEKTVLCDRRL